MADNNKERELFEAACEYFGIPKTSIAARQVWDAARRQPASGEVVTARIWQRKSTQEWVLELSGELNGTSFICRHTEPLTTRLEDVPGLPSLYRTPVASGEAVGWVFGNSYWERDNPRLTDEIKRLGQPRYATPVAIGEPVAWYDPTNIDPGQSVTFNPADHAKWPHIYKVPLVPLTTPQPAAEKPEGSTTWADIAPNHPAEKPPVGNKILTLDDRAQMEVRSAERMNELAKKQVDREFAAEKEAQGEAKEWPTNDELEDLWQSHVGHPADFAADVLERWGGCPAGLLGYGGRLEATQPAAQSAVGADGPTYMNPEQAFKWAWEALKQDLGAKTRWNVGEEVQFWAFFKYGWDNRGQYERQAVAAAPAQQDRQEGAE